MRFLSSSNFSLHRSFIMYRKDYFALERRLRSEKINKTVRSKRKVLSQQESVKIMGSETED